VETATLRYIGRAGEGDARLAIVLLRHAAQEADQRGRSRITRGMVDAAEADAERAVRESSLEKLSTDHRRLYSVVAEAGEVAVNKMYDRYLAAASCDPSDRTIRRLRQKLVDYGLLEADGPQAGPLVCRAGAVSVPKDATADLDPKLITMSPRLFHIWN
jgi:Cdc6-like AAA superfamily ATPase